MGTENLDPSALEQVERHLSSADRDRLEAARIASRQAKREAQAKAREEDAASSKRARDVVDDLVKKDSEKTGEEEKAEPKQLQPGAFELDVPETLTASQKEVAAGYAEDVAAIATQAGIEQDEAQTILESALDIAATIMPNGEEPNLANESECMAVMEHRWGDVATKELVADAQKAVVRLGADVRAWLNTPNEFGEVLGNSPAAVYALAMYQRGYTRMDPSKAASEVARLRATEQYQRGDKGYTDQVALLSKVATRGQSRELPMSRPTAPAAKSAVQKEIDAIRANQDYVGLDSKKRKPLVERMAALQAQLHG